MATLSDSIAAKYLIANIFLKFAECTKFKTLMFFGDQLTVERARSAQRARVAADTIEESLSGLEPAAADWHAEANFLQVSI